MIAELEERGYRGVPHLTRYWAQDFERLGMDGNPFSVTAMFQSNT